MKKHNCPSCGHPMSEEDFTTDGVCNYCLCVEHYMGMRQPPMDINDPARKLALIFTVLGVITMVVIVVVTLYFGSHDQISALPWLSNDFRH